MSSLSTFDSINESFFVRLLIHLLIIVISLLFFPSFSFSSFFVFDILRAQEFGVVNVSVTAQRIANGDEFATVEWKMLNDIFFCNHNNWWYSNGLWLIRPLSDLCLASSKQKEIMYKNTIKILRVIHQLHWCHSINGEGKIKSNYTLALE